MNCFISWQKPASIPICIIQGGREEVFTAQSPAGLYTDTAGRQKHSQTGLDDEETDEEEEEEIWGGVVSDKVLRPLGLDSVTKQQFCRRLHVPGFRR